MAVCLVCGVKVRHRRYCPAHSPVSDPAWRRARGQLAAAATKGHHRRRLERTFAGMSPVEAGCHGYRVGYRRAYAWWHKWAKQREAQLRGMPGGRDRQLPRED